MKYILAFLLLLSLPLSISAAKPSASLSRTKDGKYMNLIFSDLRSVSKVSYVFTYDNNRRQTGVEGLFRPSIFTSRSTRRQILGTCSTHRCVYHPTAKNFQLSVTYYLRSGGTTTITKKL